MIYLIEFQNSQIISALPCDNSEELIQEFEDKIENTHLSESFRLVKQAYYNNEEIDERFNVLRDLFDWNKEEYITCQEDFMYYTNTTDGYGMLLGGIQGHFLQELSNEYY
jgi:mannose-6-phosphate isomerase class I